VEPEAQATFRKFVETRLIKGSDTPMERWPPDVRRVSIQVERERVAKPKGLLAECQSATTTDDDLPGANGRLPRRHQPDGEHRWC
jgi:hypothetical protein